LLFFFSSRRRHTRFSRDWSSDVCSSDLNVAVVVFAGGALNWLVAVPLLGALEGIDPARSAIESAWSLWSTQTRYLGVGAMVVGEIGRASCRERVGVAGGAEGVSEHAGVR